MEGLKGCGGCHKLGLKTEAETRDLVKATGGHGNALREDAGPPATPSRRRRPQQPQACQPQPLGSDHPQWEMYWARSTACAATWRHAPASRPGCPHLPGLPHAGRKRTRSATAWGFLAVRLPPLQDLDVEGLDQVTILQGLQADQGGSRPDASSVAKAADVARLTKEAFDKDGRR